MADGTGADSGQRTSLGASIVWPVQTMQVSHRLLHSKRCVGCMTSRAFCLVYSSAERETKFWLLQEGQEATRDWLPGARSVQRCAALLALISGDASESGDASGVVRCSTALPTSANWLLWQLCPLWADMIAAWFAAVAQAQDRAENHRNDGEPVVCTRKRRTI